MEDYMLIVGSFFTGAVISLAIEISKMVNKKFRNKETSKNVVKAALFLVSLIVVLLKTFVPQEILMQTMLILSSAIAFYEVLWKGFVKKAK